MIITLHDSEVAKQGIVIASICQCVCEKLLVRNWCK